MPKTFQPNWTSSPGDTIEDVLRERAMQRGNLAAALGVAVDFVDDLIEGRHEVTVGLARKLSEVLGGSVQFWISRDFNYREDSARLHAEGRNWLSTLPLTDMIKFGWFPQPPRPAEEVKACLDFFGVNSITDWHERYSRLQQTVAFRTSQSFESNPTAVAAWLRKAELEADAIECQPWDPSRLRELITDLRRLSRQKDPQAFIPLLRDLFAQVGVAFLVLKAPSGCRASGAAFFLNKNKAVIVLSGRHLSDDHFWFSLFHELGHLVLHDNTFVFVDGLENEDPAGAIIEEEANAFAANALVPANFQTQMRLVTKDAESIVRLARRIGISPGIIVGQLQHIGILKQNQFNSLKRRYQWD